MAREPMYQIIADDLVARIADGEFPVGSQLPTESTLVTRYGVSRMTVRQAMDQLERNRIIVRRRGSGSYVRDAPVHPRVMTTLKSFADELSTGGATVSSRVVGQEEVRPGPPAVLAKLGAPEEAALVRLARVRLVDERPASYQEAWLPLALAPGLAREELVGGSLYRTLAERYGIALGWADQVISSSLVTPELAELLDEQVGHSLLVIERITYSTRNAAVEYVRSWTRAQFPLQVRLEAG